MNRRALLAAGLALPTLARAQSWPTRPIRIIVPYAPGGGSDLLPRLLAPGLSARLGQPVVVENRAGAGSMLGIEAAARATPDGHSFLLADTPHTIIPAVQDRVPYDAAADFAPVTLIGRTPMVLWTGPASPVVDAAALVAAARAAPERYAFGSSGAGSSTHLLAELFMRTAGVRMQNVPYRGSGPMMQDLAAGVIHAAFGTLFTGAPLMGAGTIRPLGVAAPARQAALPGVATLPEQGVALIAPHWFGLLAPAATPAPAIAGMAAAIAAELASPPIATRFAEMNMQPAADGPAAFATLLTSEFARWGQVAREAGVRAQ